MIHAISPIDGRYADKTKNLSQYFSEYALIKYRVLVEVEYLKALSKIGIPQLASLKNKDTDLDHIFINFTENDALKIKEIEKTTNHDVKAVEYFLREKLTSIGLSDVLEFIHFGLTSQDINNTAFPLMMKHALDNEIVPQINNTIQSIRLFADANANIPMLAHTHGQAASPTAFKKEMYVFIERLEIQLGSLISIKHKAKFGGATGNLNAHKVTFPDIDWIAFSNNFIASQGLERLTTTTQIAHYDQEAAIFQNLSRINTILIDYCRDIWTYISMEYIKQKSIKNEVGSSAMPHKVNPIDFENAEGNLSLANAIYGYLADKLPISRLQRDLTDSTVLRNIGVPFAHTIVALASIQKGMSKLSLNHERIDQHLNSNIAVIAEGIQNILRRENCEHPYELLKGLTRGNEKITLETFNSFIDSLPVTDSVKEELRSITPSNYIGYSY
jgi:adenylosuccinate lyase